MDLKDIIQEGYWSAFNFLIFFNLIIYYLILLYHFFTLNYFNNN